MHRARLLTMIAGLYVIEGLPMGVFRLVLPAWWVEAGLSKATIGFASGFGIAWSLKLLWSPLVQWGGDYRAWISGALVVMAAALWWLPATDPTLGTAIWIAVGAFCLASATQDIAIDAATINLVPRGQEGHANSMRVSAYRVAFALFGSGALFLPGWLGWGGTLRLLAAVVLGMAVLVWLVPASGRFRVRRSDSIHAFDRWFVRSDWGAVLGFILLFRLSDFALGPMLIPFQYDSGLERETIGVLGGVVGGVAMIGGAVAGGGLVESRGIPVALLWTGLLAVGSNVAYAIAALPGMGIEAVVAASIVEAVTGGMVTAAFMSLLMRICEREWAAVQYAVLTSLYAFVGQGVGALSGVVTERVGYAGYFALTALFTLPAFFCLPAVARWANDESIGDGGQEAALDAGTAEGRAPGPSDSIVDP